jgi:hypothetical protein
VKLSVISLAMLGLTLLHTATSAQDIKSEPFCQNMLLRGDDVETCYRFKAFLEAAAARQDARDRARGIHGVYEPEPATADRGQSEWEVRCRAVKIIGKSPEPDRWEIDNPECR